VAVSSLKAALHQSQLAVAQREAENETLRERLRTLNTNYDREATRASGLLEQAEGDHELDLAADAATIRDLRRQIDAAARRFDGICSEIESLREADVEGVGGAFEGRGAWDDREDVVMLLERRARLVTDIRDLNFELEAVELQKRTDLTALEQGINDLYAILRSQQRAIDQYRDSSSPDPDPNSIFDFEN
jgi:hypothetical protein